MHVSYPAPANALGVKGPRRRGRGEVGRLAPLDLRRGLTVRPRPPRSVPFRLCVSACRVGCPRGPGGCVDTPPRGRTRRLRVAFSITWSRQTRVLWGGAAEHSDMKTR